MKFLSERMEEVNEFKYSGTVLSEHVEMKEVRGNCER